MLFRAEPGIFSQLIFRFWKIGQKRFLKTSYQNLGFSFYSLIILKLHVKLAFINVWYKLQDLVLGIC